MKVQITIIFLALIGYVKSQNLESRILHVENCLTFPSTIPVGKKINNKNIMEKLQDHKIQGASVAVIHDGKIDWSKSYGLAASDNSNPVTNQTLFQCASIGKVITSLAVLTLVDEGKLDLDENVNNKLKNWKIKENENTRTKKVTLRHLLSHSAGLTDDYGFLGYDPKAKVPSLIQILNGDPLVKSKKSLDVKTVPGTKERYSGGGYLIIQLLIEEVTGNSFANYVQDRIFDPLEMSNSTYDHRPDQNQNKVIASGHLSNGKPLKGKKYNIYPEQAAAGPWTTAEDLAKLVIAMQNAAKGQPNAILSLKSVKDLLSPQINNKGLGVNLKGIHKPDAFWHSGQNLGYTSLMYGLIEQGDGAVILLNSDGGALMMQEFITSVAMEYNWPVMKSYESMDIPKNLQAKLSGTYEDTNGSRQFTIEQKKNSLFLKSSNSKKSYRIYRIGENRYTFRNSQDYFSLSFNTKTDSKTLIYSESIGKNIELKKLE